MKKMKKLFAMLLALTMVLGMTMTASAAPAEDDSANVEIHNVEVGSTINAYQIIDAKYTTEGFVAYEWMNGTEKAGEIVVVDDNDAVVGLTSEVITELAKNTSALGTPVTKTAGATTEELELTVGTWLILVTPKEDADKIYNPMVTSVFYDTNKSGSDNEAGGTEVDANENWILVTENAYAKSSEIAITKTVEDKEYAVNDKANFTVTTTIPSYSAEYTEITFKITDTIVNGLEYDKEKEPLVKVNGKELIKGNEYTLTYAVDATTGKDNFTIEFLDEYVYGLAGTTAAERAVVVTYSAKVTEDAINIVGKNEVELTYTHKPGTETDGKKDDVEVYTFEFDGILKKVEEDGKTPLPGATFTLYKDAVDDNNVVTTYTTTSDGNIYFAGLDSDVTYYVKETAAPNGYSLNDMVYKVTITPIYDNDGILTNYTVTVDDEDGVADEKTSVNIEYGSPASQFVDSIVNTRLIALPSTGGIGTTIFTVAGCGIMIAAAFFFFAGRKKEN